jgi:hypothetical protein
MTARRRRALTALALVLTAGVLGIYAGRGSIAVMLMRRVATGSMGPLEGPFLGDARRRFTGRLFVPRAGDLITLPAGGETIEQTNLLD